MTVALVVAPAPVVLASQPCPDPSTGPSISDFPEETLCSLGVLPDGSSSAAFAVSADGTVIVGSGNDDSGFAAVRWVDGAIQALGVLPGDWSSEALGVSEDHRVIVGYSDSGQVQSAVRWIDGVIQPLAALPRRANSEAYGVSADGSVIVGKSGNYAVRWVNGVIQKLEPLSGGQRDKAYGVSADGSVIVGKSGNYAVRWVNGVIQKLNGASAATAVSADGRVIVGDGISTAVQWADGVSPTDLGTLPGGSYSAAVAVSADGRVVVGNGDGPGKYESHAIRWENGVPQDLGTLPGGTDSYASGVSADGSVVVGDSQSANGHRAFVWKKTPPDQGQDQDPDPVQDFVNLKHSFARLADDGDIARGHMERRTELAANQTCLAESGKNCLRVALATDLAGANENIGERSAMSGLFSFGRGLGRNNGTTLGATFGGSGGAMDGNAFDMDVGPAVALWAEHSEFGLSRVGWQASGSIGWAGASGKATRGDGLFGVTPTTGKTDMDTRIVRASLGYGFGTRPGYGVRHNGGWLLTPRVGIAHYLAHRNGYAETGAGFTAAYDRQTTRRTLLTLAVSGKTGIGDLGELALAGGVGHDLSREDAVLSGTSDVPGKERFAIKSGLDRNDTRPFVSVGYSRPIGRSGTLSATVGVATPEFGDAPQLDMSISYTIRF